MRKGGKAKFCLTPYNTISSSGCRRR